MATPTHEHPLVRDLLVDAEELRETHISWVFLHRHTVFKVKKPVELGFLDFRTLESRRIACEAELVLNRRLAPRVYLGLVPVMRDARGRHSLGGVGELVDWAVQMVRLDDACRADRLLEAGRLSGAQLERLAGHLAEFHGNAETSEALSAYGSTAVVARNVQENFEQASGDIERFLSPGEACEIERAELGFLVANEATFEERRLQGRVRDGHGDLRLEHVYFGEAGEPLVIDCIEFNDRFRYGDVCSDIAFLSMDLAWHGRTELAERFLASYAQAAQDYDLYGLIDFYEGYRAYVRGKISAMVSDELGMPLCVREEAERDARRYFRLALACERTPWVEPRVIAVGGMMASGKSTFARALGAKLAVPVIDTDGTRKHLFQVAATTPLQAGPFEAAYSEQETDRVYAEVLRRAEVVLRSGRSVVLDATFRSREQRARARALAGRLGLTFRFVECRAPHALCRERLRERALGPSVSDGRLEVFEDFVARWEPFGEAEAGGAAGPAGTHVADTSGDVGLAVERFLAELPG